MVCAASIALWMPAQGDASSRSPTSTDGYRFVGAPIALFSPGPTKTEYTVYVRLNRGVPRLPNGSPLAGAYINGYGFTLPPAGDTTTGWGVSTAGNRARHCYTEGFLNVLAPLPRALARPHVGQLVRVAVYIKGAARPVSANVHLERLRSRGTSPRSDPYQRRLGCVQR